MQKKSKFESQTMTLCIYGIWSKKLRKIIFISLNQEDVELEYDIEGYTDETHHIVNLAAIYDITSLE